MCVLTSSNQWEYNCSLFSPHHQSIFCHPAMETGPHLLLVVLIVTIAEFNLVNTNKKAEVSMCDVQLVNTKVNTEVRQILCQLLRYNVERLLLRLHLRLRKLNAEKRKLNTEKRKLNAEKRKLNAEQRKFNTKTKDSKFDRVM